MRGEKAGLVFDGDNADAVGKGGQADFTRAVDGDQRGLLLEREVSGKLAEGVGYVAVQLLVCPRAGRLVCVVQVLAQPPPNVVQVRRHRLHPES